MLPPNKTAAAKTTEDVLPSHRPTTEVSNCDTSSQSDRAKQAGVSRYTQIKLDRLVHSKPGQTLGQILGPQERRIEAAANTTGKTQDRGGDRKSEEYQESTANFAIDSQATRAEQAGVSHYTQRKLDRLARDYPELHGKVKAGELTVHAASKEAGIEAEKDCHASTFRGQFSSAVARRSCRCPAALSNTANRNPVVRRYNCSCSKSGTFAKRVSMHSVKSFIASSK